MNKIQKVLNVGEMVFTPAGQPLKVERIGITGIYAGGYYFSYEDHRKKFYMNEASTRK